MNTKDSLGRTVFHYAYMCGNPDIIAMLQDHRYLKQSINDESTIRSWNIKWWIIQHITKYLATNFQFNVHWYTQMNSVLRYKYNNNQSRTLWVEAWTKCNNNHEFILYTLLITSTFVSQCKENIQCAMKYCWKWATYF